MFKIDSEKELLSFLKILSEESVNKSKAQLREKSPDSYAAEFSDRLKDENELYEQEDDSDPELAADESPDDAENTEGEEAAEEAPEAQEKAKPTEELRASLDSLERNINSLRAGRSLKDSTVETQLEIYFDRLGEDEKSLMVLFIRELSKILSGKVTGDDAVDPNQEPYNLDVVQSDDEEVATEEMPQAAPEEAPESLPEEAPEDEEDEEDEADEEDNSPPIKVNERQDLREIRKKIKKLMRI